MRQVMSAWALLAVLMLSPIQVRAIEPAAVKLDRPTSFEQDIQSIFDAKCVACHNEAIAENRLILEDVAGMLKGGKRGPALVAKDPAKSLIYLLATRAHEPAMPPLPNSASAESLTPEELGLLKLWIEEGAVTTGKPKSVSLAWQPIPSHMQGIQSVALGPWGRFVAASRANQIDIYDLVRGQYVGRPTDPNLSSLQFDGKPMYPRGAADQDFVHALAFHPDGQLLASAGYRGVKLWQRGTTGPLASLALDQGVTTAAMTADGTRVALAMADRSVRLLERATGKVLATLTGAAGDIQGLQWSADGTRVYAVGLDKTLRCWNAADGKVIAAWETPSEILSVALASDGQHVWTGHQDQTIRKWPVPQPTADGQPAPAAMPVAELKGHGGPVTALAVIAQPAQLVSGSGDGTWKVWDAANGNQTRSVGHGASVTAVAVNPEGTLVATAGGNFAKLWNINGQPVGEMKGDVAATRHVIQFTDDDTVAKSRVALADAAFKAAEKSTQERQEQTKKATEAKTKAETDLNTAREADTKAQEAVAAAKKELEGKPEDEALKKKVMEAEAAATKQAEEVKKAQTTVETSTKALAQAEQGQKLAEERQQELKRVHEAEVAAQKQVEERLQQVKTAATATERPVSVVAFASAGQLLVTSGDDGVVRTWDVKTAKPLDEWRGHKGAVFALLSGADRNVVTVSRDATAALWDVDPPWTYLTVLGPTADNPLDRTPSPFTDRVLALAFSPDGKLLATGGGEPSRSGELMLWDVATRSFAKSFPEAHSDTVFSVGFSYDGKWLLSGAADKFVKVHEVDSGKLVRSFEGHTHHVLGVSFKADGSRIASAGADNAIKIWNVETGEQHRTIQNYSKQVTSIQFLGTSDNIVSSSGDRSVKFHRANDGGNYRTFGGATDYVYSTAALRDESIVVAGGEDGVLRVWNGTNGQALFTFEPPKQAEQQQAAR